jgi:hypothetical protein
MAWGVKTGAIQVPGSRFQVDQPINYKQLLHDTTLDMLDMLGILDKCRKV